MSQAVNIVVPCTRAILVKMFCRQPRSRLYTAPEHVRALPLADARDLDASQDVEELRDRWTTTTGSGVEG